MNIRLLLLMAQMGLDQLLAALNIKLDGEGGAPGLDMLVSVMNARAQVPPVDPLEIVGDVGVISVRGPLLKHASPLRRLGIGQAPTYAEIAAAADKLTADPNIAGAVIRLESPGGTVMGSRDAVEAIRRLSAAKPTVAHVDGLAASAGYNLAAVTRRIVLGSEVDIVGSVGGVIMLVDWSEAFKEFGLRVIPVTTGKLKASGAFGTKITEDDIASFQRLLDDSVKPFFADVARGRGLSDKQIRELEADVFVGGTAVEVGLADEIGSLNHAIALARGGLTTQRTTTKPAAARPAAAPPTEVFNMPMSKALRAFLEANGLSASATLEQAWAHYRQLTAEKRTEASALVPFASAADQWQPPAADADTGAQPAAAATTNATTNANTNAGTAQPDTGAAGVSGHAAAAAPSAQDMQALVDQGMRAERSRVRQIRALGAQFGVCEADIEHHVSADTTVASFKDIVLGHAAATQRPVSVTGGEDGRADAFAGLVDAMLVTAGRDCLTPIAGRVVDIDRETGQVKRNADGSFATRPVNPQAQRFLGRSAVEVGRTWLASIGVDASAWSQRQIAEAMIRPQSIWTHMPQAAVQHTTADFSNVLANVASKSLAAAYDGEPVTYEAWAGDLEVPDFKTHDVNSVGRLPTPSLVREGAEYQYVTFGEKKEQASGAVYGYLVGLTMQMIVNDDLGAFATTTLDFIGSARCLDDDLVWAKLTDNPTLNEDATAMIHANHGNLNEGSAGAFAAAKLSAMRAGMRLQTGVARTGQTARRVNIQPRFVLCPEAIADTVGQLLASLVDITASNNTPNFQFLRTLMPVADPRLDAVSTTAYYLAGPKERSVVKRVKVRGFERPTIQRWDGQTVDGVTYKLQHVTGAAATDYRAIQRNDGA